MVRSRTSSIRWEATIAGRGALRALATALIVTLGVCASAVAAPPPQPYGTNDAGGFRNILPPGQNGHADAGQVIAFSLTGPLFGTGNEVRPPHNNDQLAPYANLVYASPTLAPGDLPRYFKDAGFGARPDDVRRTYSPRGDVTIVRDRSFGVPHVYGDTRAGAMFGAGYTGAEDRLFLMDVLRHAGRAQLSSFIGGSEGNRKMDREQWRIAPYTEADLQRQFDLGDEVYGEAGEALQEDVTAYVAGINKYICEAQPLRPDCSLAQRRQIRGNNGATPLQKYPGAYAAIIPNGLHGETPAPRLWRVTDVIATASLVGGIFGKGGGRELDAAQILQQAVDRFGDEAAGRAVFDDFRSAEDPEAPVTAAGSFPYQVPPAQPDPAADGRPDAGTVRETEVVAAPGPSGLPGGILPDFPEGASNALLVSGAESQSGRPLAVFGPQTGYFSPQILMEIDIHAPAASTPRGPRQGIDARGAAFPGVNMYVQLGRGRDYAWSATSAGQDITDTFALELCEPGGGEATLDSGGYLYRGRCEPIERLERRNRWLTNAADQSPPGTETLRTNRTKLGLEVGRARIDGRPVVYTQLRSTYFHEADSALGFVDFNDPQKMSTPAGFMESASKIGFTFNWFYAGRDDIAYFNSGNNPVRQGATDQDLPVRACGDDGDAECEFEWRGWDPDLFVSDYTAPETHPQAVNQPFLTSWNNKQARDYRAADDNFAYGSIHRSEPLDDRIGAGIAAGETMSLTELVDAMEDAGTVDLRGDKVLPFALQLLGEESDPVVAGALDKLRAWVADGAHRRDKDRGGTYEHSEAIKIMDAWWPRWIRAQFEPVLGPGLYDALALEDEGDEGMVDLDDEPNANGTHVGSAYIAGWYGYAEKDLRSLLGESPAGAYSRRYCGGGDRGACEQLLRETLLQAIAEPAATVYQDEVCAEDDTPGFEDPQLCFDAIAHTTAGAVSQPLIHWINRPTFQQVVEIGAP
ncbi:MAG TPA: penicillin acylase family protein [Thermoleophilaceae bacterium]|nr:penicillin acylase family protein [Thermoleophilaceae bacterium]